MAVGKKDKARKLLETRKRKDLVAWARSTNGALRTLFSMTFDAEELLRWRAVEAVGAVAGEFARDDLERVKEFLRRLLWMMNDESGGLGWRAPEAIGEILVNVPGLIPQYGKLLPRFFHEEPFERGSRFAVHRVARVEPEPFRGCVPELRASLENPDSVIRAYSALALLSIGTEEGVEAARRIASDPSPIPYYNFETGASMEVPISDLIGS